VCGIVGIVACGRDLAVEEIRVASALGALSHRGPDGSGLVDGPGALIGHRRLAIIDLEGGAQPMASADGRFVITFNGQVFNYVELRQELEQLGHRFRTRSDTEVLLAAYERWGPDCAARLRGMFAFAVLDCETGALFAARDRFGIKPFFYAHRDGLLAFASEPKAIHALELFPIEPDPRHFNEYLVFGYLAGDETLLRGVKELQPGHHLRFDAHGPTVCRYAVPWQAARAAPLDDEKVADELHRRLREAVGLWTRGDVEVTSLMSGGVDSPLATALAAEEVPGLRTFAATFPSDPEIDESATITRLSSLLGVELATIPIDDHVIEQNLDDLVGHFDEPVHDSNCFTMLALCAGIRESTDVKVVLCGEGADELFGGYERHRTVSDEFRRTGDPDVLVYARNVVALPRLRLFADDVSIADGTRHELLDEIRSTPAGRDPVNAALMLDQATFLGTHLRRMDRVGMRYGLEIRVPYLDHPLVAYVNGLPSRLKIHDGWHKWILRRVAERKLPDDVVWRRQKIALGSPLNRLLEGELGEAFRDALGEGSELATHYSSTGMMRLLEDHRPADPARDHSNTLWRLFSLELWLRSLRTAAPAGR
jgi:asparagine synthase (glutamine-hydrolysing)